MVTDIDVVLVALADPTRRGVIELLRERPRRAGELAAACGVSGPAMSKHLRVLRASGLVDEQRVRQDARVHLYHLRPEPFIALQSWLDQVHAYWTDQLAAFKGHIERTGRAPERPPSSPPITPDERANEEGQHHERRQEEEQT
jgi:DNA-binding transcriptional ArsR family regulator